MSNGRQRVAALHRKLKESFGSWQEAYADGRCRWLDEKNQVSIQDWIIRGIWDPGAPGAPIPDPDLPGGEVVAELCTRFEV